MAIEKIQELSQGEEKEKPEKMPPPKEEKDTSAYGGKPYLERWKVRQWLRKPETYKIVPLPKEKRAGLEKELFGSESGEYGSLIEKAKREPESVLGDLETGKIKPPAGLTKDQVKRLLKKFLGQK